MPDNSGWPEWITVYPDLLTGHYLSLQGGNFRRYVQLAWKLEVPTQHKNSRDIIARKIKRGERDLRKEIIKEVGKGRDGRTVTIVFRKEGHFKGRPLVYSPFSETVIGYVFVTFSWLYAGESLDQDVNTKCQ